jgi:hypothetical protein
MCVSELCMYAYGLARTTALCRSCNQSYPAIWSAKGCEAANTRIAQRERQWYCKSFLPVPLVTWIEWTTGHLLT